MTEILTASASFWMGLLGGFAHCSAMCGGFIIAAGRSAAAQEHLHKHAALTAYELGRGVMYSLLTLALVFAQDLTQAINPQSRKVFSIVFGAALVVYGLHLLQLRLGFWPRHLGPLQRWTSAISRRIFRSAKRGYTGYLFAGLGWGLLPCGLSWAAIAGASQSGPWWYALAVIGLFFIGTLAGHIAVAAIGVQQKLATLLALVTIGYGLVILARSLPLG